MTTLRANMIVVHEESGSIGRCVYSTFGLSVSGRDAEGHWHTLGQPAAELAQYWRPATADEIVQYEKQVQAYE